MIPVFRLKDLQKRPNDPNARVRAMEMVKRFKDSDDEYRRICEEKGIPYIPVMCSNHAGTKYFMSGNHTSMRTPKLGDLFNR